MKPRTEEVRQFIELYGMIRSDKTGSLSKRELDWTFLVDRFDTLFELSRINGQLIVSSTSPRLAHVSAMNGAGLPLSDFLPPGLDTEISALFDEVANISSHGILAEFATADDLSPRQYELVLLPAAAGDSVTAIGVIGSLAGPSADVAEPEATRALLACLRLRTKYCFDLRQRLPSRFGGFLVQCVANLKRPMQGSAPEL